MKCQFHNRKHELKGSTNFRQLAKIHSKAHAPQSLKASLKAWFTR